MGARLAFAIAAALMVIVSAPFVGQLRGAIQAAFPGQYRVILVIVVSAAAIGALAAALVRVRERRRFRFAAIAAAFAGAGAYAMATATGNADVDAVERFHFVEYGLVTFLFYRVWHDRGSAEALVLPFVATMITGLLDEWMQWFVPGRVGEFHDVLLNAAAAACGLAFSAAVEPPRGGPVLLDRPASRWYLAIAVSVMMLGSAAFLHTVHLGHDVHDAVAGTFRTRFSAEELAAAAADRAARWQAAPLVAPGALSREDQYLAEALWHIQRRNERAASGDAWAAVQEDAIVERYFAPVLETAMYSAARWSAEQRADLETRVPPGVPPYVSDAHPFPIYPWNPVRFWLVTVLTTVGVWLLIYRPGARASTSSTATSTT